MRFSQKVVALCLGAAVSVPVLGQTLKEEATLLDRPDGAKVATGKAGTSVKIKGRQGFWAEVEMGGKSGWIQLGKLSFTGGSAASVALDTGRAGTGNIISTSSARGLSARDLINGKPDVQSVTRLEGFIADAGDVGKFRMEGGIYALPDKVSLAAPLAPTKEAVKETPSDPDFDKPKKSKKAGDEW
jgi:hypothetical protein